MNAGRLYARHHHVWTTLTVFVHELVQHAEAARRMVGGNSGRGRPPDTARVSTATQEIGIEPMAPCPPARFERSCRRAHRHKICARVRVVAACAQALRRIAQERRRPALARLHRRRSGSPRARSLRRRSRRAGHRGHGRASLGRRAFETPMVRAAASISDPCFAGFGRGHLDQAAMRAARSIVGVDRPPQRDKRP